MISAGMTQGKRSECDVGLLKEVERLRREIAQYEITSDEDSVREDDT